MKNPLIVCVEGVDGSGKSTLVKNLEAKRSPDFSIRSLRDPGSTALGEAIRKSVLFDPDLPRCPEAEAMLFMACRAELNCFLRTLASPFDDDGKPIVIVLDRYSPSTYVYQLGNLFNLYSDQLSDSERREQQLRAYIWLQSMDTMLKPPEIGLWVYLRLSSPGVQLQRLAARQGNNFFDVVDNKLLQRRQELYDAYFQSLSAPTLVVDDKLDQAATTDLIFNAISEKVRSFKV